MELLAVGALAIFGYMKTRSNKKEEPKIQPIIKKPKIIPTTQKFYKKEINVPDTTNVQNRYYTRDSTYNKKEVSQDNFIKPEETIQNKISASYMVPREELESNFSQYNKFQSVPLTEPIQVGPGLNAANEISKGGFHSFHREMPRDFAITHRGAPGRANHGTSKIESTPLQQFQTTKDNKRFFNLNERPLEKGKGSAYGPETRSDIFYRNQNRGTSDLITTSETNLKGSEAPKAIPDFVDTDYPNNRNLQNQTALLNAGVNNRGSTVRDTNKLTPQTQRGNSNCHITSAHREGFARSAPISNFKTTLKEMTEHNNIKGHAYTNNAPKARQRYETRDRVQHTTHASGAARMNILNDPEARNGDVQKIKNDNKCNTYEAPLKAQGHNNFPSKIGMIEKSIKIEKERPLDLNIAVEVLKNNQLALKFSDQ